MVLPRVMHPASFGQALLLSAIVSLSGCGKDDFRDPGDGAPVRGIAMADCAPWDGAATSLFFAAEGLDRLPPPPPYLHLVVYDAGSALPAATFVLGENRAGSGIAVRCTSDRDCATAEGGRVEFAASPDDSTLSGAYRISLPDGVLSSTFTARWVRREALCG